MDAHMDRLSLSEEQPPPLHPPASSSTTPAPPTPDLPLELWAHIVSLSAPPPLFDNWPARSSALRALALVSRAFRSIAQGLLLRRPVLLKPANLALLLRTLEEHGEGTGEDADEALWRRSLVRGVRIGNRKDSWADGSREVGRLLELCQRVEEVRLYQVGQIEVAQLAKGQALRRLFIVKTTLRHAPELLSVPLCLPHLEHLHLHLALANVDPHVGTSFFTPDALPRLSAFARFALGTSATEAALVRRLSALSLSKSPPPSLMCPGLELWDCQSPLPAAGGLSGFAGADEPGKDVFAPASVQVVRFSRPTLDLAAAPAYLERFPQLQEVRVRDVAGSGKGEGVKELRRWCEGRLGGAVRLVVESGEEMYVEGMFGPQFWKLVDRMEREGMGRKR